MAAVESLPETAGSRPSVSVIVCAYTEDRWDLLVRALKSVALQFHRPHEIVLCIDHNPEMFLRCRRDLPELLDDAAHQLRMVENRYGGHLGSARTTAAEEATGDILAFLDDDAAAEPDWLRALVASYTDPSVIAVGGAPIPEFETQRPRWLPLECDWVFGCAYRGLPARREPIDHLIGANMSVRRAELLQLGGFHSDNHDDMDLSHRVAHRFGTSAVVYEPSAVVRHYVSARRVTWAYFWRRCFNVNKGKVAAFRDMEEASNIRAELAFVKRAVLASGSIEVRHLASGDVTAIPRYAALLIGIALGGAGHVTGRAQMAIGRRSGVESAASPDHPQDRRASK